MESPSTELVAPLGFTRAEDVAPDPGRPGLLRARTRPLGGDPNEIFDYQPFVLHDCVDPRTPVADLEQAGFQTVDLSGLSGLQQALETVRREDRVSEAAADAIRASLQGAALDLGMGRRLKIEHVADDGLIQRRAGPNGLDVNPGGMDGANGHGGAPAIHGDQDVFGTPLRQMMNGSAPDLFRHQTPDARNDTSSLFLLNLWIPIQQITRPLVLMDRRTLDAKRHQILYGLPVTRFLERDDEMSVNDIWTFLPDPAQTWYFRSEMGPDQGYVFDTLGEPHGACILPGEDALETSSQRLDDACAAVHDGDADALRQIAASPVPALPEVTTAAIRGAWQEMGSLLQEAAAGADAICADGEAWTVRARQAIDRVIRKSVEMRLVATLTSD